MSLLPAGGDGHLESESLLTSDGPVGNGTLDGMLKMSTNVSERISDRFGNKNYFSLICLHSLLYYYSWILCRPDTYVAPYLFSFIHA